LELFHCFPVSNYDLGDLEQHLENERQFLRKRIIGQGEVISADGSILLVGSLFNISDGGAMISVPHDYIFPEQFRLRVVSHGVDRPATVAWQRTGLAGLKFLD
jgi:hypothetical protein